jgi:hypothetical protein
MSEFLDGGRHAAGKFLERPRHSHGPGGIAKMSLERANDARNGEPREGNQPAWVITVDGVDESDGRHLRQVVRVFAFAGVAARQSPGQRQALLDDPGAELDAVGVLSR